MISFRSPGVMLSRRKNPRWSLDVPGPDTIWTSSPSTGCLSLVRIRPSSFAGLALLDCAGSGANASIANRLASLADRGKGAMGSAYFATSTYVPREFPGMLMAGAPETYEPPGGAGSVDLFLQ